MKKNSTNWRKDEDGFSYKILWLSFGVGENKQGVKFHIESGRLFAWKVNEVSGKIIDVSEPKLLRKFNFVFEAKNYVDDIIKMDGLVRQRYLMRLGVI